MTVVYISQFVDPSYGTFDNDWDSEAGTTLRAEVLLLVAVKEFVKSSQLGAFVKSCVPLNCQ
ncbi:hypothetical protein Tcan_04682 [Toxocara canis]|uniref:Uncharacterized protein n=1 Tax=Toxocara canis TaxID=6265 RepID=A0A0B2VU87_TOXCA|nr:hypothetical protein Tcan_04682 [Toxocara canis]